MGQIQVNETTTFLFNNIKLLFLFLFTKLNSFPWRYSIFNEISEFILTEIKVVWSSCENISMGNSHQHEKLFTIKFNKMHFTTSK